MLRLASAWRTRAVLPNGTEGPTYPIGRNDSP